MPLLGVASCYAAIPCLFAAHKLSEPFRRLVLINALPKLGAGSALISFLNYYRKSNATMWLCQIGFRGRVMRNTAPSLAKESTVIVPPCLMIALWVTKSPIPVLLFPLEELNSLKIFSSNSLEDIEMQLRNNSIEYILITEEMNPILLDDRFNPSFEFILDNSNSFDNVRTRGDVELWHYVGG